MLASRDYSIRRKLTLLMIVVSSVALLVASAAFVANHYAGLRTAKASQLTALADVLASNSTAAMEFHRQESAADLLKSLANRPTVRYACLFDPDGEVFAAYRRDANVQGPTSAPDWDGPRFQQDGYLTVSLPVVEGGDILGRILIQATTDDLRDQFYRDVVIAVAVFAVSLVVAVLISARLQRVVSQPILDLAEAAGRVTERGDYSIRVEPRSGDEIGSLYRQFNLMLQRIQSGEEELRRLTSIIETTSDLVGTSTPDGRVTYINRAGRRMLGIGADKELTEITIPDLHPEWAHRIILSAGIPAAAATGTWEGETAILGPEGNEVPVSQVIMSHRSQEGELEYASTIIRDITERKRAAEDRETLIVELEAKNAELEQFAYTVSHDLKSPLITIKGYLGMLKQDLAEGNDEAVEDDSQRIGAAADKMNLLLGQVLELSRIGRVVQPPENVGLSELAHEVRELLDGTISAQGVDIQIAPGLPILHGDRLRLVEVLQNLMENAMKYMGDQPKPRVEIGARLDGDEMVCYVEDNGVGIDPRYHQRVFGLFDQLDQHIQGSGVGLALTKRIIEVHGGRIWVVPRPRPRLNLLFHDPTKEEETRTDSPPSRRDIAGRRPWC